LALLSHISAWGLCPLIIPLLLIIYYPTLIFKAELFNAHSRFLTFLTRPVIQSFKLKITFFNPSVLKEQVFDYFWTKKKTLFSSFPTK